MPPKKFCFFQACRKHTLQVSGINNAIAERRRGNVHQRIILTPGFDDSEEVFDVHKAVAVKVR
jgi:hypothetical protein